MPFYQVIKVVVNRISSSGIELKRSLESVMEEMISDGEFEELSLSLFGFCEL
jgi:hypothetical protein